MHNCGSNGSGSGSGRGNSVDLLESPVGPRSKTGSQALKKSGSVQV